MLNCTYSHNPLALPLGELSPQATERALAVTSDIPSPSSRRSGTSPKGRGKEYTGKEIFDAYLPVFAGKIQENRSGFLGRFKEVRREIEIPPGPKPQTSAAFAVWKGRNEHRGKETPLAAARSVVVISDAPLFLLEKQKKKWVGSHSFVGDHQPSARFPHPALSFYAVWLSSLALFSQS